VLTSASIRLKRLLVAVAGGVTASILVALAEAHACFEVDHQTAATGSRGPSYLALVLADAGLVAPIAVVVALVVGVACIFLEPDHSRSLREHANLLRSQPVLLRSRTAAILPLSILVFLAWTISIAHLARHLLARGAAWSVGLELAAGSTALFLVYASLGLALLPSLRRTLAAGADRSPRLLDPVTTGSIAAVLSLAAIAIGVRVGSIGGDAGGVLGIFGVLKRPELDLRPAVDLAAIAMSAYVAMIAFARRAVSLRSALLAAVLALLPQGLTVRAATSLDRDQDVARAVERLAPFGKISALVLRKLTDRDHDGASPLFGGGDCDDHDAKRSPTSIDVPGNGIDEDCSGSDLPAPAPAPAHPASAAAAKHEAGAAKVPSDLNVILITIDTLRPDVGFMGYPKPTTPNLDRLAAKGVVFDDAYAMASYTGKSLGPLLIGKYPSETRRNGAHFNTYAAANVFLAERFAKAGFRTAGAASHWYFNAWTGLSQGFAEFDLSAKPPSGQGDTDTSVTSKELTDAALRIVDKPETTSGRFFLWVHYFDPHAQYAPHAKDGAPSFLGDGEKGAAAASKAAYDGEVWFTDKHVGRLLDRVASEPWGKKTAIIVTADHGEAFAEHGMSWHGVEIWEPLVRVPLLVYVPGVVPHHVPLKRGHVDLVPTILDIAGIEAPADELSGQSLIGDVMAKDGTKLEEKDVYIDMPVGPNTQMRRAIVTGPTPGMKLIQLGPSSYNLFDLAKDPAEKEDLSRDRSKLGPVLDALQSMRARLKEIEVKPDPGG
jgi:choline-sulfatase